VKTRLLILIFIFCTNSLFASQIEFTPQEKTWLEKHPVINVSNENDWPPFDYAENGIAKGYSVDLIKILAKNIGVKVNFIQGSWPELLVAFDKKSIDLMHVMTKDKEREQKYSFSSAYMQWRTSYFIRDDDNSINSVNDLWIGKKIAAGKGWSTTTLLKKLHPKATIIEYENTKEMLEALSSSEVDACVDNVLAATYEMNKNGITGINHGGFLNLEKKHLNNFHFVSHKDSPELASVFTKAFDYLSIEENLKLQNRWFETSKDRPLLLSEQEKEYIKNNTITYAGDPQWLPFEAFDDNGNYSGIVAEHIEIVEKKLHKKFDKIITNHWLDTLELSKIRGVDIISGDAADVVLSINYKAIDTYLKNPLVIVTRKEHPYVDDLNNIKDKKIAFGAGGGYSADILKKYPDIKFIACDTPQSGLLGVKTGKYDAFIGTLSTSDYMIVQMGIEDIKIAGQTDITMNLTLFVDREKPLLYSIINKAIKTISKEKQHEIISKWRSRKITKVVDYTLVWQISMVFLVLVLIGFFFTFMLRQSNKRLKRLEQETRYLSERMVLAFDGSRDGLWDWDLIENSVYFSPRWKEMLGYRDDELENSFDAWKSRIHPDDLAEVLKDIEASVKDEDVLFENKHRLRHKDGHWVWIYDRGKVQHDLDGKAIRMIGTHTDLTTEINLSDELSKMNNTLEKRVKSEVEKNREHQLIMLQQSRHAQMGEMISMIAHQWRQPLNNLSMLNQSIALTYKAGKLDDKLMDRLSRDAKGQIEQMSQTIDDFRDFFKPDKKAERFSVNATIDHVVNLLNPILKENGIVLKSDLQDNIETVGFSNELGQSLVNIVNNAKDALMQKSANNKKVINIILRKEDANVLITITDNGGGIDLGVIDKIFDPYFSTKQEKNGTGLGLYMSKTIIEEHMNGTITATNTDSGAEFVITLSSE